MKDMMEKFKIGIEEIGRDISIYLNIQRFARISRRVEKSKRNAS